MVKSYRLVVLQHVSLRAYSGATACFVVLQHVSHSLEVLMVIMHTRVTVDDTMNRGLA